jgi:NAD(P)-dependent dehydrogenase (short-subunit alcohol dehydrogenase family)
VSTHEQLLRLFSLAGRVAVVTGGASGIGKGVSRLLADAGATVVVADSNLEGAQAVASEMGAAHIALQFDLADEPSIVRLFSEIDEALGRVDILVNNAGIYPRYAFEKVTAAEWQRMQSINVWGSFVALREAARLMRRDSKGGRIVNISSIGALRTAVNDQLIYNASKAALDSMTQSAALELARDGILVNSILPGAVRPLDPKPKVAGHTSTPPTGPLLDAGRILLGRHALAEEIAAPVLMLVSAAGGYITGQSIVIDGGFSVS